jgi:hypothetical protein
MRQRDRHPGRRADPAGPHAAGRLHAGGAKLLMIFVLIFFDQPDRHPRAGARRHGARPEAALGRTRALNRGDPAIETLIINVLLVLMAVTVLVIARSRNLFGVVVLERHLQLPDGHRAGGDGRGRRGDDRGLGRRRAFPPCCCWARCCCARARRRSRCEALAAAGAVGWPWAAVLVYGTLGLPEFPRQGADPRPRGAALPEGWPRNRRAQRGDRGAGQLPRLRHLGETTVVFTAGAGV